MTPIEQAAQALRLVIESTQMHPQVRAEVDAALARLTTEQPPVPPDRENAAKALEAWCTDSDNGLSVAVVETAIAALRSPELEAKITKLKTALTDISNGRGLSALKVARAALVDEPLEETSKDTNENAKLREKLEAKLVKLMETNAALVSKLGEVTEDSAELFARYTALVRRHMQPVKEG